MSKNKTSLEIRAKWLGIDLDLKLNGNHQSLSINNKFATQRHLISTEGILESPLKQLAFYYFLSDKVIEKRSYATLKGIPFYNDITVPSMYFKAAKQHFRCPILGTEFVINRGLLGIGEPLALSIDRAHREVGVYSFENITLMSILANHAKNGHELEEVMSIFNLDLKQSRALIEASLVTVPTKADLEPYMLPYLKSRIPDVKVTREWVMAHL